MTRPRASSSRVPEVTVTPAGPRKRAVDQDPATPPPAAPPDRSRGHVARGSPAWRPLAAAASLFAALAPCGACARRPAGSAGVCAQCMAAMSAAVLALPPAAAETLWLGPYAGVWLRAVHALKYRGAHRMAPFLGELLARRIAAAGWAPQLVTHVPTTRLRRRRRGYDQAELIAVATAARLGLPHAAVLTRLRATAKLAGQGRAARGAELKGAFTARYLAGRHVLLIDDVLTTGHTLAAASEALLAAGAGRVTSAVVARTAPQGEE